jgi:triacylglycerol lipase
MLARLQQVTTLAWLSAVCGWVAWHWHLGQPLRALVGAAVLLSAHAVWLALGFAMAFVVNRNDPAPRATPAQLLRAWWGEVRAAPRVFCWQQPFRSQAEPDHLPASGQGRPGVLLVHGFICNRGLWNPWMANLRAQGVPFVAVNLEPVFGSIDDYVPLIEAAMQQLEAATGRLPLLVGHSMGGLAIRAWLREMQADARVRGVVTLGTPHSGTWLARWALTDNGRQMRLGSDWLARLAADEPLSRRQAFVCYFGHCDNIVFPASTACLPGAQARHVTATAHVDLVHSAGVMVAALQSLGNGQVVLPQAKSGRPAGQQPGRPQP